jgi:FkbM family methyltransferase
MNDGVKSFLVGTAFGQWLLLARDKHHLLRAAVFSPETLGTIVNDQLATRLVASICRPGHVFVDVGAHIGSVVANARRRSRPSQIVAIEAIPAKALALQRRFPGVDVVACAVGDREGVDVPFYVDVGQSGYSSLVRPVGGGDVLAEIKVPLRTLDEVLKGQKVDVVKIDIEGAELGALRGGRGLLSAARPTIMFESAPGAGDRLGYSTTHLWRFFADLGYAVIAPNRLAHDDHGLSLEAFNEGHLFPRRSTNYFAVAHERRSELRETARRALSSGPGPEGAPHESDALAAAAEPN